MALWLVRGGKQGEHDIKFLQDNRVYLTWDDLKVDLGKVESKEKLVETLSELYEGQKPKALANWAFQIWFFANNMEKGDWVVLPSKASRTLHFGEIIGNYEYDESLVSPYYHYRSVNWFAKDIPRDRFDKDILYSLGAFLTVCQISRNNAEERIKAMYANGWNAKQTIPPKDDEVSPDIDLEEHIMDQISNRIIQRFKGHKMELLIAEILKAKGFTVYASPEGTDYGVDLLASSGTLGFDSPRICVQVKSHDAPVDRPTMDQLVGTMSIHGADFGLLVSWSGFKNSVTREVAKQFFKVRLWDSTQVIKEIFANYDRLSDELKAEIPLKRIWMLNTDES